MTRRLEEIDALRGLMLVWITLTHLPTVLSQFVNQPFGFISAAEGFIFLSALFAGRVYFRLADRDGFPAMYRRLGIRTLRLYGYHIALLAFAFTIGSEIAIHGSHPGVHNLLDYYFAVGPRHAGILGALLIYRPPLLDILPMYILFLVFTPIALTLGEKIGWKFILGGGFVLWLMAEFGFRQIFHDFLARTFGFAIPLNEMGYFDLWAWQFLWVLGLWFGVKWAKNELDLDLWSQRLFVPALVIAPILLGIRIAVGRTLELNSWEVSFDKWHLGVFRLIDFAMIATLAWRYRRIFRYIAVRPLVLLGQASLQVFCAHLLFCFIGLTIMGNAAIVQGWWWQVILLAGTFTALYMTAKMFSRGEERLAHNVPDSSSRFAPKHAEG
ncbi:MAG TPA: OpgC domain-containing protein [Terriglobales bacterium]|jgi:hypothetical protein